MEVGNGFVEVIATSGDSHLGVCVRERVCERERERERESVRVKCVRAKCVWERVGESCLCVCVWKSNRGREQYVCERRL